MSVQGFHALESKYPNAFDQFVITDNAPTKSSVLKQTTMLYDMCAAHAPYYVNTDYQGSDLIAGGAEPAPPRRATKITFSDRNDAGILQVASAQDCCAKCVATAGCKYFTFGSDVKKCWPKSGKSGQQTQSYRTSGDVCMWTYPPTDSPTALPTSEPSFSNVPDVKCSCATPNQGTGNKNGFTCTDGTGGTCTSKEVCSATTAWTKGAQSSSFCAVQPTGIQYGDVR
jgi:hypothetical protein